MKKNIKRGITYFIYFVLILYISTSLFAPKATMSIFGFRSFIVISSSMEPDIPVYDMIVIKKAKESNLETRDIITFEVYIPEVEKTSYVTHYIGEITTNDQGETIYKTQGATKAPGDYDQWTDENGNPVDITFDDIDGVYMFKIPYVGHWILMLRDPIFVGLLVVNGGIIYAIYRLIKKSIIEKKTQE